ncbi:zinc-binding dehydrogenase [Saccharothrix sp.]|uniref:zinc-binding dehydrogenase n=1 Tax=Saccharothrix sp. TaxID=1873460 RepID=UPI0035C83515
MPSSACCAARTPARHSSAPHRNDRRAVSGGCGSSEHEFGEDGRRRLVGGEERLQLALQFAKLLGARVIATTGRADKEQRLRDLGADDVVNAAAAEHRDDRGRAGRERPRRFRSASIPAGSRPRQGTARPQLRCPMPPLGHVVEYRIELAADLVQPAEVALTSVIEALRLPG